MTVDEQIQSYRISLELTKPKRLGTVKLIFNNIAQYTVGTESIQTPLHFSLFVILQPFAKII